MPRYQLIAALSAAGSARLAASRCAASLDWPVRRSVATNRRENGPPFAASSRSGSQGSWNA
jgi:hypothetical protein